MKRRELHTLEMLARVRAFGTENATVFAVEPAFARELASLATIADELTILHARQAGDAGARKSRGATRAMLRARLLDKTRRVRQSAAAFADELGTAVDLFARPSSKSDRALLSSARAFVERAQPFAAQFAKSLLDTTFFDELAADIASFEDALSAHGESRATRAGVTASVADATARGRNIVQRLDALIANHFGTQPPSLLASWRAASRIHASRSRNAALDAKPAPDAEFLKKYVPPPPPE